MEWKTKLQAGSLPEDFEYAKVEALRAIAEQLEKIKELLRQIAAK